VPWEINNKLQLERLPKKEISAITRLVEYLMQVEEAEDIEFHTAKIVKERIIPSLDSDTARTFVAEIEGKIIGVNLVEIKNNIVALLAYIAVSPEYQGAGIGSQLIGAAEDYARSKSIRIVQTIVHKDNKKSKKFHQKLGYDFFGYVLRKEI
jgi:ribosomal protein S18 acetylase RimI-like enzyme